MASSGTDLKLKQYHQLVWEGGRKYLINWIGQFSLTSWVKIARVEAWFCHRKKKTKNKKAFRFEDKASLFSILSSEFLRGVSCIHSHRRKSFLSTIRHICFQIPFIFSRHLPIFEIALPAKPGGVRDSSAIHRHSNGGGSSNLCGHCRLVGVPT